MDYSDYMARRWTKKEEARYRNELVLLYKKENKTIQEIGQLLKLAPQTVFQRLQRLEIKSDPRTKKHYLNRRSDISIPGCYSEQLAEFFGVMLGDGSLSHFQIVVTLGNKEEKYAQYVVRLVEKVFSVRPRIAIRKKGYRDVYLGSVQATAWLFSQGLVGNKVKCQVDVPKWIFSDTAFMRVCVRGFFDTDGSVYRLKFGIQLSFSNKSRPLLISLQYMLSALGYTPSEISADKIYITKRKEIERFFREVKPANSKHQKRYCSFQNNFCAGSPVGRGGGL